ncbi:hypothetical protein ElyMa_004290600 [Elysia marginata]|uniref:Uncharacterized protein n=1 Tax=Elysia marginata TaxID=1093978 RepID=A0AAV4GX70_9GAST|nr:hypothetical protein ElyMa_004290600 [Elysia marginata]
MMYTAEYIPGMTATCKKEMFKLPSFRCMTNFPSTDDSHIMNLEYMGSSTLGLKGMGIDYDSFNFKAGDYAFTLALGTIPGTTDMCYPVLEDIKGGPENTDSLYMFLQMSATVEDPSIMSMPAPCVGNNVGVVG